MARISKRNKAQSHDSESPQMETPLPGQPERKESRLYKGVWGVLAVVRLLGTYTFIIPVNEIISSSTVTKLLYENNFLYDFLAKSTNLQEAIAGLIGKFGTSSENTETAANIAARISGAVKSAGIIG